MIKEGMINALMSYCILNPVECKDCILINDNGIDCSWHASDSDEHIIKCYQKIKDWLKDYEYDK